MPNTNRAIAIVGYSCRLPEANGADAFWSLLDGGRCVVGEVQDDRWSKNRFGHPDRTAAGKSYTWRAGQISDPWGFDPMFFGISPREALQIDPQQRILLQVVWEALEHAGVPASSLAGSGTGVYVGAASVDYSNSFFADPAASDIQLMTGNTLSIVSNRISYIFDLKGPSFTVDTACSSSIVALHEALEAMRHGRIDSAIVGGVNMLLSPFAFIGFSRASMLSPSGLCRAFDADGDGYVRSEGAVALYLKTLDKAMADGDPIRGVIVGSGVNSDGRTVGLSLPSSQQQAALLEEIYERFDIDPRALAYVEAHGTGTRVGDPAEAEALGRMLGQRRSEVLPIGSVKTNIGHLEAASGLAGLLKAQLALENRRIPPSLHFSTPNPDIDFTGLNIEVVTEGRPIAETGVPLHVGINSFGFGGTNAHAVIREPMPHEIMRAKPPARIAPLVISAQSPEALRSLAVDYKAKLGRADAVETAAIANAAAHRRDRLDHRLVAFGSTPDELADALEHFLSRAKATDYVAGRAAARAAKVAFVFSGNGSQWAGMGQAAYHADVAFRGAFDTVSRLFMRVSGWSLATQLFSSDLKTEIDRTEIAQPLLFAVQVAAVEALRARGVTADMVVGHSVGEVAAAWAAGALSLEAAVFLIHVRSTQQEVTRDLGSMAALQISAAETAKILTEPAFRGLVLAADNSPRSVTVSGTNEAIAELPNAMKKRRIAARRLNLSYPFHSALIEPIHRNLTDALATLKSRETTLPFYSTVTGRLAAGSELDAEYWWLNVRNPVLFRQAIEAMAEDGAKVFLEIGPSPVLRNYVVDSITGVNRTGACLTSLEQNDQQDADIFGIIAARAITHGARIDDERFFGKRVSLADALPRYPWQNQPYRVERTTETTDLYGVGNDHPLLGFQRHPGHGPFVAHIDRQLVPWLGDHKVESSTVFPAAGYVEQVLAAGRRRHRSGPLEIRDFDILRPLLLEDGETAEVQTELDASSDLVDISSRRRLGGDAFGLHVRARIGQPPREGLAATELPAITGPAIGAEALYELTHRFGLNYGPAFRRALSVAPAGERRLLVDLAPAPAGIDDAAMVLHPTLLDAAFHGLFLLIRETMASTDVSFLPVRIDTLRVYADGASPTHAVVTIEKASPRSVQARFTLLGADGTVLALAEGVRFKAMRLNKAADPDDLVFTTRPVRLLGLGDEVEAPKVWASADERLQKLGLVGADNSETDEASLLVDAGIRAVAYEALQALADKTGYLSFDLAAAAERVAPSALPLFYRAVEALDEDGAVTRDESGIRFDGPSPYPAAETVIATLVATQPAHIAEAMALVHLSAHFGERLRNGLVARVEDVLPAALFNHLESASPSVEYLQKTAETVARDLATEWPADRPLRLLLTGQSGVALARRLAHFPKITHIVVTDPDDRTVERALIDERHRHGIEVVSFGDLAHSAFGDRAFDVVLTLGLGALPEAGDPWHRIAAVLAPRALAIAIEPEASLLSDLVCGQAASWWTRGIAQDYPIGARGGAAAAADAMTSAGLAVAARRPLAGDGIRASIVVANRTPAMLPREAGKVDPVLVLVDGGKASRSLGDALAAVAAAKGRVVRVASAHKQASGRLVVEAIDAGTDADLADLLASGEIKDVVFAASPTDPSEGGALDLLHQRVMALHAMLNGSMKPPARLWLLAPGGSGASSTRVERPVESGLWGLGRVLINEYPDIETRMIDLAVAFAPSEAAERIADLLAAPPVDHELVVDERGVAALRIKAGPGLTDLAVRSRAGGDVASRLMIERQGSLDGLRWQLLPRPAPAEGEVEIEVAAAGLNFRDVMWALGLLPEEALEDGFAGATLGMECSGRISRVGPGVSRFSPGDRVIAFAPACFASHVTVAEKALAPLPANVDLEAAATIPVTFLTAYYGLTELARLDEGETILIHGGAGGVGLAALQIALSRGARVIATAGTPDKRRLLTMLGAHHVLDSRSLAFADDVLALTDGAGVDVVLNSLSGEAMERSIECLRPFGRFIELGKRDYYANSRIALRPFRQNLSYFGVDADQLLTHRPKLTERLFADLVAGFEAGNFTPLPFRIFEADRITEAFRLMQGSGHIGKILVRPPRLPSGPVHAPIAIRSDATYLVAGGLGGFGAETARFLAGRGARHLVLASRSGKPTAAAAAVIEALRADGVTVETAAVDLTDAAALGRLLDRIDATMPPLRGVLHTAMVLDDALFMNLDSQRIHKVLAPKVAGAELLDRLTRHRELDLFVLYSSATTLIGNPGQAAYVAANAYLEGLARARRLAGLPAVAIAWGAIGDAGYLARNIEVNAVLATRLGKQSLTARAALDGLGLVLDAGAPLPVVAYAKIDWSAARRELALLGQPIAADVLGNGGDGGADAMGDGELLGMIKGLDRLQAVKVVGDLLTAEISRILRLPAEDIGVARPLTEVGMDSLMAVELRMAAEQKLGVEIPILSLANGATIGDIARRIVDKALGQDSGLSDESEAVAGQHLGDGMDSEDIASLAASIESTADNLKRLM